MELYILGALEDGESLPTPTSIRNLPCTDTTYPTLVQTDIDLAKNSKSVKKTLTIPAWLNDRALAKGINFSQLLQEALVEKNNVNLHHQLLSKIRTIVHAITAKVSNMIQSIHRIISK